MKKSIVASQAVLGLALLYSAALPVHAQEERIVVETVRPTLFMNGGIGQSEQAYMRKAGKDFKLRVEFSERKDNEFVADADLTITDLRGNPVFVLPKAGPIVNINLPDGRYRVAASVDGKTETQLVTLRGKAGGQDLYFHWKGKVAIDPFDGKPMGGNEIPG